MKILRCPLNGDRNIAEFANFGEVTELPEPADTADAAWADHIWLSNNTAGVVREWWCHLPSSYWFIAERNTLTDEILRTYPASDVFDRRRDFKAGDPQS